MEISINKDLRKYKSKDIAGFTFKQFFFLIGGLLCILIGALLGDSEKDFVDRLTNAFPLGIPCVVLGFFEIKGMSVIQYLKHIGPEKFLMKKQLIWMSDFKWDENTAKEIFGEDYEYVPTPSIMYDDEILDNKKGKSIKSRGKTQSYKKSNKNRRR